MSVPYNLLPIETHVAMINAEMAQVPVLQDAAEMWTEVRAWIDAAQTELRTRTGNLTPNWNDDAGRALAAKIQERETDLATWGERIDASNVSTVLTTLAAAIPPAQATVSGLYASYLAAIANPLTAPAAAGFQQASGACMSTLGAQFDVAMLAVCGAAGVSTPADLVPGLNTNGVPNVSASDLTKTANDATAALTALQGLDTSLTGGGSQSGQSAQSASGTSTPSLPDLTSAAGPSLAGLPALPTIPNLPGDLGIGGLGVGDLTGGGVPPVAAAPGAFGAIGGTAPLSMPMMPGTSTRAAQSASGEEVQPGNAVGAVPMSTPIGGMGGGITPPQPGSAELAGNLPGLDRRAAESGGVLSELRGRSGAGDPTGFTLPRVRQSGETDLPSVEVLDEELWQVRSTST